MNLTLNITENCNMGCKYCFATHTPSHMDEKTAFAAVDLAVANSKKFCGFGFFGGEPMLESELIIKTVEYEKRKAAEADMKVSFRITTNGTLLNEKFIRFATNSNLKIAFSHDGLMHDDMRQFKSGEKTSDLLASIIPILIQYQPKAVAMCTVTPHTVHKLAASVKWLYEQDFRKISVAIDYRIDAGWTDETFEILNQQYNEIGEFYIDCFQKNDPLVFINFDNKIKAYIEGDDYCGDMCLLGKKQPFVGADGTIYPCIQFSNIPEYEMGNVFDGIDRVKQEKIFRQSLNPVVSCEGCAISDRCRHNCACLNYQLTGNMNTVSALQCSHERILIPVADAVAARLFAEGERTFLKRYYKDIDIHTEF